MLDRSAYLDTCCFPARVSALQCVLDVDVVVLFGMVPAYVANGQHQASSFDPDNAVRIKVLQWQLILNLIGSRPKLIQGRVQGSV